MRDNLVSAESLLAWYDVHGRELPWRVKGGPDTQRHADPYRVWLSEVMLQQTTVAAVKSYFARFTALWPTVQDLAAAEDADVMREWAGLGYYARARNLLACARAVVARGGFPSDLDGLRALPGVGPYTAAAVASIAFGRSEVVVDGNVERVMARVFAIETPLPAAKPALVAAAGRLTPVLRPGDYAQAVMDLGATICTPRSPACGICPWMAGCAGREIAATLPRKLAKAPKPTREGVVWVLWNGDAVLLERRPDRGLLGGTLGFPGAGWDGSEVRPPAEGPWEEAGVVTHTFTHFHLNLRVLVGHGAGATRGEFHGQNAFSPQDLPTLMRKAHDAALRHKET
ncbi:A/G-specific adenine glycosylase [Rhodobacter sp. KR11]|uniref:A/G-specific adenine glycosylase n=1 Tax=Rhodobacter sp. KR11 TaxID=2974588 RepID=UPI00222323FB|nr:A/G-specific adenine glycosylase [Rhodobacter sp. KR11]MCW1918999.1 A/G-specific adenine glycosylase [Rhodobacter sp. KR11]